MHVIRNFISSVVLRELKGQIVRVISIRERDPYTRTVKGKVGLVQY